MRAILLALLTAVIWGIAPLFEKAGLQKVDPIMAVMVRGLGVTVLIICFLLFSGRFSEIMSFDRKHVILILTGGILASFVGQLIFYQALKTGEVSRVVPVAGIFPLVTFILGVVLFHEQITATKLIGVAFIVAGLYFIR
jgi:bacterial/archaeal transporter family protein